MKYSLIFSIIAFSLLLFSCTTQKNCLRKFPPQIETIVKDSIVYKIDTIREVFTVTLHDTIQKQIKADTVYLTGNYKQDSSYLENEFSISVAKVQYNELIHYLEQKEQVRLVSGEWAAEIAHHYKEYYQSRSETKIIREKFTPKFVKIMAYIGGGFILLLIIWLILKIKGGWVKGLLR